MAVGAPMALNAARQKTILDAIRSGATDKRAAQYAGISFETVKQWRRKGDTALLKKANQRSPSERKYVEFVTQLDIALADTAVMMQSVVTSIASYGLQQNSPSVEQQRISLTAATWWLSHRERDDYTTRQEVTGKDGAPLELSASEALGIFRQIASANPISEDDDE